MTTECESEDGSNERKGKEWKGKGSQTNSSAVCFFGQEGCDRTCDMIDKITFQECVMKISSDLSHRKKGASLLWAFLPLFLFRFLMGPSDPT